MNGCDQRNGPSNNGATNHSTNSNNITINKNYAQPIQSETRRIGSKQIGAARQVGAQLGITATATVNDNNSSGRNYNSNNHRRHYHQQNPVKILSSSVSSQPTPLFERLVTEEVQELKAYARIIENQNRKLVELERIHGDLENRLELESRGRTQLEATLERRETEWTMRYHNLEKDRDQWKNTVSQEQTKNVKLIDQVVRKDQDIHRMLQRKYDNQRESGTGPTIRNIRHSERQGTPPRQSQNQDLSQRIIGTELNKSPHEILETIGSMETVRIRNVKNLLSDFFSF